MIDFYAFSDELQKIAEERSVSAVKRLPRDKEKALDTISRRIDRSKDTILGFPSVAVPLKYLGDLKDHGFKKTRLAVPLPWERAGAPSWRRGQLHAHRKGEHFVFHKDRIAPKGVVAAIKHWAHEGVPAMRERMRSGESSLTIR